MKSFLRNVQRKKEGYMAFPFGGIDSFTRIRTKAPPNRGVPMVCAPIVFSQRVPS